MSAGFTSNNTTIKIKSGVGAGYTPAAGEYVAASYSGYTVGSAYVPGCVLYFGPGQAVQSYQFPSSSFGAFISAVCFINSP